MNNEQSKKYTLNTLDFNKIGKGMLIAVGAALLVYLEELIPQIDFGQFTGLAVAVNAFLVNAVRKWLAS